MKTNFAVYLVGYALVIAGVWYGIRQIELIDPPWPTIIALILIGLGIVYAFSRAQTDTARREQARGGQRSGGNAGSGNAPSQQQQGGTQPGSTQQGGGTAS